MCVLDNLSTFSLIGVMHGYLNSLTAAAVVTSSDRNDEAVFKFFKNSGIIIIANQTLELYYIDILYHVIKKQQ